MFDLKKDIRSKKDDRLLGYYVIDNVEENDIIDSFYYITSTDLSENPELKLGLKANSPNINNPGYKYLFFK